MKNPIAPDKYRDRSCDCRRGNTLNINEYRSFVIKTLIFSWVLLLEEHSGVYFRSRFNLDNVWPWRKAGNGEGAFSCA
jgi:hypothetical protein